MQVKAFLSFLDLLEALSEKSFLRRVVFPTRRGPVRISPEKCLEANRSSDSICRGMYFILSILNRYFK